MGLVAGAGIGRLDVVRAHFERTGEVAPADAAAALVMAAWYDEREVITYMLDRGVPPGSRRPGDGSTALHVACYSGYPALVQLLIARGASLDVTDPVYGTPPLVWALHAWLAEGRRNADDYKAVLRLLAGAGAAVRREWIDDERIRADGALHAALARRVVAG